MDNKDILKDLDLSALDKLSPAEKKLALSILEQYSKEGKSELYDELLLEGYEEIPIDIEEALAMPRDNVKYESTWFYKLSHAYKDIDFIPKLQRHLTSEDILTPD